MSYKPKFSKNEFRCASNTYILPDIAGEPIIYTYIRKNASSAFKKLILRSENRKKERNFLKKLSPILPGKTSNSSIKRMEKYLVSYSQIQDLINSKSVFVYRDPYLRAVSTYTNKFIFREGATDILKNFRNLTALDPNIASFRDFVAYIDNSNFEELDCHIWPQKSHLLEIEYTNPINLDDVCEAITPLIGKARSKEFFQNKTNPSLERNSLEKHDHTELPAMHLRAIANRNNIALNARNFYSDDLLETIYKLYQKDYEMISSISATETL